MCALEIHFAGRAEILGENAGMHLMVRLRTTLNDEEVVGRVAQVGTGIVSARIYYLGDAPTKSSCLGMWD